MGCSLFYWVFSVEGELSGNKKAAQGAALDVWRTGRDSNPRPPAWQAGILTNWTTSPQSDSIGTFFGHKEKVVGEEGIEPPTLAL